MRADGVNNWNLAVAKMMRIGDRVNLKSRDTQGQRGDAARVSHNVLIGWRVVVVGAKRWMRIFAAGVCFLQLASTPSAAEPELVKLAVSEGKDILFAHLTSNDGLSPGAIRHILQDDQGSYGLTPRAC